MSKIIIARLEAKLYVWLGGFDISTEPKETRGKSFETACKSKLKEVYPKASQREIKEMLNHLREYWIEVFKREL